MHITVSINYFIGYIVPPTEGSGLLTGGILVVSLRTVVLRLFIEDVLECCSVEVVRSLSEEVVSPMEETKLSDGEGFVWVTEMEGAETITTKKKQRERERRASMIRPSNGDTCTCKCAICY